MADDLTPTAGPEASVDAPAGAVPEGSLVSAPEAAPEELPGQFVAAGTPVYRATPDPSGTAVAASVLPAAGAAATADMWLETTENSTTKSYFLVCKAGVTYYSPV